MSVTSNSNVRKPEFGRFGTIITLLNTLTNLGLNPWPSDVRNGYYSEYIGAYLDRQSKNDIRRKENSV